MNRIKRAFWIVARPAGILGVLLAMGGCGGDPGTDQDATNAAAAEVRGEPIRGEPIVAPGPDVASTAADPESDAIEAAQPEATSPSPAPEVAASPAAEAAADSAEAPARPGEPLVVTFDKLASFQYDIPDGPVDTNAIGSAPSSKIPESVRSLDDKFVSLRGFMLPLKVEKGLVTELLIMRDQSMCCYGTVPRINEWVSVKMVGEGVKPVMDQAVTLFGKLKVGEMYENGYLVGIYAMDGERMAGPLDM